MHELLWGRRLVRHRCRRRSTGITRRLRGGDLPALREVFVTRARRGHGRSFPDSDRVCRRADGRVRKPAAEGESAGAAIAPPVAPSRGCRSKIGTRRTGPDRARSHWAITEIEAGEPDQITGTPPENDVIRRRRYRHHRTSLAAPAPNLSNLRNLSNPWNLSNLSNPSDHSSKPVEPVEMRPGSICVARRRRPSRRASRSSGRSCWPVWLVPRWGLAPATRSRSAIAPPVVPRSRRRRTTARRLRRRRQPARLVLRRQERSGA